jgi:hypothetical protein
MNDAAQRPIGIVDLGKIAAASPAMHCSWGSGSLASTKSRRACFAVCGSFAERQSRRLAKTLEPPRIVLLYLLVDPLVDETLAQLLDVLKHAVSSPRAASTGGTLSGAISSGLPAEALTVWPLSAFQRSARSSMQCALQVLRCNASKGGPIHGAHDTGRGKRPWRARSDRDRCDWFCFGSLKLL